MSAKNGLEYNPEIAKVVRHNAAAGVTLKDTFMAIQHMAWAPASMTTFMKKYGTDWFSTKAELAAKIGDRVVSQALKGDIDHPTTWKSQELYLRSQAGWSPKSTEESRELDTEEGEAESAVDAMLKLLGKDDDADAGGELEDDEEAPE